MIKVNYITTTTIQKKKRVTEQVDVKFSAIRYKDTKNRIVKFDARKKLRVEVVFKVKRGGPYKTVKSATYGLPLRRRKRPVSEKIIHNQIARKHLKKIKRGHLIVSQTDPLHNLYAWTYFYQAKSQAEKRVIKKAKIERLKKARTIRSRQSIRQRVQRLKAEKLLAKGSRRGHHKT